jgi:hypothetical protein
MALDDNAIPDDDVAAAFHKNRPPFSGLMVYEDGKWNIPPDVVFDAMAGIDKTTDDGI